MAARSSKKAAPPPEQVAEQPEPKRVLTPEEKLRRLYKEVGEDMRLSHLRYHHKLVIGQGKPGALAMVVVEMPEPNDEQHGVALTGVGGVVLADLLSVVDLKRTDHLFVTPMIKYRPNSGREATPMELSVMLPYLLQEIEIVDPKYIVTCGRYVNKKFFPRREYLGIVNQILPWKKRLVIPTLHPVSAAKDPDNRRVMLKTFRMLGELA